MVDSKDKVIVIGAGLAGSEAALMVARFDHPVDLYEMKPKKFSPAHQSEKLGELVCSNSFGSEGENTAPGLLKREMSELGSLLLAGADVSRVPAGRSLGVDREKFSDYLTKTISNQPQINLIREECKQIPRDAAAVIIATGPLTSEALAEDLAQFVDRESLYFYDSISPIVTADSIDYEKTFWGSRYQPENQDYLNCPMDRELYERFVDEIRKAEKVPIKKFEAMKCFEACLPVEVLAERGVKTLAFGPMKPVGLDDPRTGKRPYAVVQLRRENDPTTMYNLVGFQTRLKWGEQKRIFSMIPGLENAEFVRMGSMHRNTYLDSPKLICPDLSFKKDRRIFIAGQITGVEGYVESACMGQWAGLNAVARLRGVPDLPVPPAETAIGSLVKMISSPPLHGSFAPMNINFGLIPHPKENIRGKEARRRKMVDNAIEASAIWRERIREKLGTPRTMEGNYPIPKRFLEVAEA